MINYLTRILPVSFKKLTIEEQRKWTIVLAINFITIAIQSFYLHRYNTYYKLPIANYVIGTCMFSNLFAFYFFCKQKYKSAAVSVLIPGTIDLIFLIFLGGGINAPGTFWLAILPFFYGVFFGKAGAILGAVITFSTYGLYLLLYSMGYRDSVVTSEEEMIWERTANLFNYSLVMALYYTSYTVAFERSNNKLIASKELIDNLFRVVLHDITNPISAIKMRLELMKRKADPASLGGLEKMEKSVKKVTSILENLRDYKAIEDGTISIPMSEISMTKALSQFIDESGDYVSDKEIDLQVKIDLSHSAKIYGNIETLCSQVFTNVFSNAVKFSQTGGVITIKAYENEKKIFIEVSDKGVGIPDKIVENLFRFDKPTSRMGTNGEQGTGYGLPIMKYFLELMNGSIEVITCTDDTKDRGTTFRMIFQVL
jgi:signal transduction histidine kinase